MWFIAIMLSDLTNEMFVSEMKTQYNNFIQCGEASYSVVRFNPANFHSKNQKPWFTGCG